MPQLMNHDSRILIVDDIEENLRVLTDTLTAEGLKTLQAKDGKRAIQIAEKAKPDLILLDIKMPGMDGYQTIEKLKCSNKTCDIPVIFISALNQIEDKVKGFHAGAVDYISKPFQKEEVVARVTTHLKLQKALRSLQAEKEKSEKLLLNVLPSKVASDLKETGKSDPQSFENVTIFFSDLVDFTNKSAKMEPKLLLDELNDLFTHFDEIIEKNHCERIKTIGDAYLAVCGIPEKNPEHAINIINAALEILNYLKERNINSQQQWELRIGIHTGKVVGGIVGVKKYIYDIFGDSINTASRMESYSEKMKINISEETYKLIHQHYTCQKREPIEVKGKGKLNMYFLNTN
ncbi:MAG: response regulator [Spirochaetes bacterium]|nr:response regulator [Spirochaetota bacterium]